jgi:Mor family transcriptional regulator
MSKAIAWNKIKADYLNGVTPKELANKYKIDITKIYNKIDNDSWAKEKTEINENIRNDVQERIKELTNLALETLSEVIKANDSKYQDKVSASKAILDVSGLKAMKIDAQIDEKPIKVEFI